MLEDKEWQSNTASAVTECMTAAAGMPRSELCKGPVCNPRLTRFISASSSPAQQKGLPSPANDPRPYQRFYFNSLRHIGGTHDLFAYLLIHYDFPFSLPVTFILSLHPPPESGLHEHSTVLGQHLRRRSFHRLHSFLPQVTRSHFPTWYRTYCLYPRNLFEALKYFLFKDTFF